MTFIGLKDSMNTIQSKLNKAGEIRFTTGVYNITKQLILPANIHIDLNGATLRRKASIQSIFLNKVTPNTTEYNGAGNITIENGTFEGMGGYSYDNLLTFFHSHNITIENCTFKDILCHAIEFNSSFVCTVENCKFLGYNLKDKSSAYKECIQIDHAGYSGFVLSGSSRSSKCYDGTCCKDIEIFECIFDKSNYRDYPYACIGEHSQLQNSQKHQNIKIFNNIFKCKKNSDLIQACLSLTNMENVDIHDNVFDCNKVARIYSKDYSYDKRGNRVKAKDGDGICDHVSIVFNTIIGCTKNTAFQQYNKSGKINHKDISKKNNDFI